MAEAGPELAGLNHFKLWRFRHPPPIAWRRTGTPKILSLSLKSWRLTAEHSSSLGTIGYSVVMGSG